MKIHLLIGPVASGKTSYCRNAARQGIICLNDDNIVNMLHGGDYTLYDSGLKLLYKSIENQIIATALSMQRTIIVDRGLNVSLVGRKRFIALAQSFDVSIEAIVFKNEGPEVHAKRRTESDSRGHDYEYWKKVAEWHHSQYVEPTLSEGFDVVHHISFEEIQRGIYFTS